jgi:hypothetical protein
MLATIVYRLLAPIMRRIPATAIKLKHCHKSATLRSRISVPVVTIVK